MPSQSDITTQICAALAISEPDLDTAVGSVTRNIIDAVASAISDASLDSQLLTYQYDIYSMTGSDLDAFVQLFGLSRYPAARSTGLLTFSRGTSTDVISVPINTQVASTDGTVTVQTLAAVILSVGVSTASVVAQAVVAGPAGNVAAGTFTQLQTAVSEINGVTNPQAFTGGSNQETDSQLQARWVATVFRNMAGTSQMFLGLALNNSACTAANVVGPQTRWTEQLQIEGGAATSTVSDAQYIYPAGQMAGNDISDGDIAAPGVQYTWNYNLIPPTVTVIDHTYFPAGDVFDLSYIYLDVWSRNEPAQGIFNRVDVWCVGSDPEPAAQTLAFSGALTFSNSGSSQYFTENYVRPDGTAPSAGNIFVPLAFGPIMTMTPVITVGTATYGLATPENPLGTMAGGINYAYQIVHQTGAAGWGPYSNFGLEWVASMAPASGSVISISEDYTYNEMISEIQADLENWRLAGTDVIAHQALQLELQFSLAVVYDPAVSVATTQTAINTALAAYLSTLGFSVTIYPASVIAIVEGVPGVIACRFLKGSDYAGYNSSTPNDFNTGIQQVINGVVVESFNSSSGEPNPVETNAATVPAFGQTVLVTKALNTMGSFG
jgi:uncharacterized phage protein gp47/JayE